MATENTLSQQLLNLLATRNVHPEMLDKMGKPTDAQNAKTFTFDYTSGAGKNYGTMVIVLDVDNDMKIMYGDNLGKTMEGDDKQEFFDFIGHLNQTAKRNRWTHTNQDISQLKHTMQGMAAIQEGLFEGYYGTRKISYAGQPTEARLQIVHSQPLGENDARYRHIAKMFIETADGERFKLGFKSLAGAKAMLEHVRQGGKPYDVRGCHITETVNEIAVLSRFNRASATRIVEGSTQELITEAQAYYQTLRENLKHMATSRGYTKYFESWHPATINEQEGVVDNIKTLFIEQSIDSRIEAALPLLAKIQQRGQQMKEADIFESWINNLGEGTWNLPETPEQLDKLKTLMTKELIVGPDATNATEQLYDLIGDDILFDRLSELANRDPRANAWNDTEVMDRIRELGIEMPEPAAPGNPAEPQTGATAPVAAEVPPNPVPMAEEINAMRKAAGLPVVEGRMLDESGEALEHVLDRFKHEVRNFEQSGELDDDLYDALFDYYSSTGEMPYGVAKARTGDPHNWIADRLGQHLNVNEADPISTFEVMSGFDAPTTEGTCNSTMEGEYCPEHGLAECGYMESMGGTVAGAVAPVMDEETVYRDGLRRDDGYSHMEPKAALDFTQADTSSGVLANIRMMYKWASMGKSNVSNYIQALEKLEDTVVNGGDPRVQKSYKFIMDKARAGELNDPKMVMQVMDQASKMMGYGNIAQDTRESKHDDPMNYNAAITSSYYESKESDSLLARIKSLALLK